MILDSIANLRLYEALSDRLAAGLHWLKSFRADAPDGRVEIDGDDLFAMVQSYVTSPGAEKRFESHRRYADIQYVASGRERILHTSTEGLEVESPYDEENDITFFRDPNVSSSLLVSAGDFMILWPGDAHKPGCMAGGREEVKKVVIKVRL
ncbi:YhcH/YjgK/YiaL family protein [soil metagenome]